jgi:hypothetical protein
MQRSSTDHAAVLLIKRCVRWEVAMRMRVMRASAPRAIAYPPLSQVPRRHAVSGGGRCCCCCSPFPPWSAAPPSASPSPLPSPSPPPPPSIATAISVAAVFALAAALARVALALSVPTEPAADCCANGSYRLIDMDLIGARMHTMVGE